MQKLKDDTQVEMLPHVQATNKLEEQVVNLLHENLTSKCRWMNSNMNDLRVNTLNDEKAALYIEIQ